MMLVNIYIIGLFATGIFLSEVDDEVFPMALVLKPWDLSLEIS